MKKSILFFVSAAALFLSGCEDGLRPGNDNGIKFSASKLITKTVYDENDDLQINWVSGDQVKIYCLEAEDATEATYNVNPKETKNKGNLSLASGKPLQWGGDTGVHNFFSVYPASSSISVENGVAICKVNTNQVCTVRNSGDANMIADPDMNNAYMVANLSTEPVDKVELHYRPIMTTLKITVRAKTEANQELAAVTGVSIISKTKCYSDSFSYDIVNNSIIEGSTTKTVTTFVGVQNGESAFVDLDMDQTLTLTAFIPPVDINAENPVQVRLHAQHSDNLVVTLGKVEETCVKAASKRSVTLPHIPSKEVSGNNWITPLDDNIYVSQLSIPGTHDAATSSLDVLNLGKAQEYTIQQQLEMGIRCFDLRPTVNIRNRMGNIYHGILDTGVSLGDAFSSFNTFLESNPGEFVIVVLRNETGDSNPFSNKSKEYGELLKTFMDGQGRVTAFKPDITVGEMRGKILALFRDNPPAASSKITNVGWTHSQDCSTNLSIVGGDGSGILCVQDMYSSGEMNSGEKRDFKVVKVEVVKKMLDYAARFNTEPSLKNVWMINHCSGYEGANNYCLNAQNVNLPVYNYLVGKDKKVGPTGIMMLDYVGTRRNSYIGIRYNTYGDLLPQAIIDNNYKYHMLRKGE